MRDLTDSGADVLVDAGRWMPGTPWPVLTDADMVLLALRPGLRHLRSATPVVRALRQVLPLARLGLAVCAASNEEASETAQALNLPTILEMPHDPATAAVFSDGATQHHASHHSPLLWSARCAARRLHAQLRSTTPQQPDAAADEPSESAEADGVHDPAHFSTT